MTDPYRRTARGAVQLLGLAALVGGTALVASCSSDSGRSGQASGNNGGGRSGSSGGGSGPNIVLCTGASCLPPSGPNCEVRIKSTGPGPRLASLKPRLASIDAGQTSPDCNDVVIDWSTTADAGPPPPPPEPPKETFTCPAGTTRIHVRDIWSKQADPSLGRFSERPQTINLIDKQWKRYAARQDSAGCDWYAVCAPVDATTTYKINAADPSACPTDSGASGDFALGKFAGAADVYIDYVGTNLTAHYAQQPAPVGASSFRVTTDAAEVGSLCAPGKPDQTIPDGFTKLHVRWPWGDPVVTGYPGTACGKDKLGFDTPPYPTSVGIDRKACNGSQATLEFQDGKCPWYSILIPNDQWTGMVTVRSSDNSIFTPGVTFPEPRTQNEYWLAYVGAPDNVAMFGTACMNFSQRANVYQFFTQNPGPGYAGCGGDGSVKLDPCSPPKADGYETVHFRYIWAGQKTFTFFPKPEFMPRWIVLEVNGGGGDKDIICFREADRPWYNCPVPKAEFKPEATWRAVDKAHQPEWNTVAPRPFPDKPGEYWLRWHYGKPDIPATSEFKFYDYYPDGTNGDWSATGDWKDDDCAPKPPPVAPTVGFGGWFPYARTGYSYPFGSSLARTFPESSKVQDLLDAFVSERYVMWRDKYVTDNDKVCGPDTARVKTFPPETVSEGQGYGMALAAAVGDKPTFAKLWNFVRRNLSQSSKKYCGGLMGWMWDGTLACRPADVPCDPDTEACDGNRDSAFDGDVDIGIALVFAARQWPEYIEAASGWILKMECEVNDTYDGVWKYPTPGDTFDKNCQNYPNDRCWYTKGNENGRSVNMSYYPPGYFRVFGDFLNAYLDKRQYAEEVRLGHRQFWYRTAETVYELVERCYDAKDVNPGLVTDWGSYSQPCSNNADNYNWARFLWRVSIDAAWFGNRKDLPENAPNSSPHYAGKSRMQAKIDNIQAYFREFYKKNPVVENANRFSTLCREVTPDGNAANCDPAYDHNSYFVNTGMSAFVSIFDDNGATNPAIRREAIEEAVTATVMNDSYYQESIGVYSMLFLTGNFPNPMEVP